MWLYDPHKIVCSESNNNLPTVFGRLNKITEIKNKVIYNNDRKETLVNKYYKIRKENTWSISDS